MHPRPKLLLNLSQLASHAFTDRLASYHEAPQTVLPADMREPQKVERLRFPFSSTASVLFGKPAELDPARLIWVQFQSKLAQSLSQTFQKAIGVRLILESQDDVVRIADKYDFCERKGKRVCRRAGTRKRR
jgi:hypothetical protein